MKLNLLSKCNNFELSQKRVISKWVHCTKWKVIVGQNVPLHAKSILMKPCQFSCSQSLPTPLLWSIHLLLFVVVNAPPPLFCCSACNWLLLFAFPSDLPLIRPITIIIVYITASTSANCWFLSSSCFSALLLLIVGYCFLLVLHCPCCFHHHCCNCSLNFC